MIIISSCHSTISSSVSFIFFFFVSVCAPAVSQTVFFKPPGVLHSLPCLSEEPTLSPLLPASAEQEYLVAEPGGQGGRTGPSPVEFWPLVLLYCMCSKFYSYGLYYGIVCWKDSNKQTLFLSSSLMIPPPSSRVFLLAMLERLYLTQHVPSSCLTRLLSSHSHPKYHLLHYEVYQ